MLLEDAGFTVEVSSDGHQAVSRALSEHFDLVVASVQSETLGGLELCVALRHSDIAVVLTSADAGPDLARRASAAGAKALIRKGSLSDSELVRAVTR